MKEAESTTSSCLQWERSEMHNLFCAAARAQSRELKAFNLSLLHTFQSLPRKTFKFEKDQEAVAPCLPSATQIIEESKPLTLLEATGTINYPPRIQLRFLFAAIQSSSLLLPSISLHKHCAIGTDTTKEGCKSHCWNTAVLLETRDQEQTIRKRCSKTMVCVH